ncbi:glycosyltransferase [Clostridium perfringens]|uniref:MGDG synthase family glycosyltransferase n=1 Tax=Clostridium perfringens TaxID=1502 RepID=UPI002AC74881|nr:glycosyltransferase [Clostridium perfringens]MDZ5146539.1 glycosyltransferase [Clostridium perfringens]
MKVIIFYAKTGGGHLSACKSLEESLNSLNIPVVTLDSLEFAGHLVSKEVCSAYTYIVKSVPELFGALYNAGEKISDHNKKSIIYKLNSFYADNILTVLEEEQPDIIISTHIFATQSISYLKQKNKIKALTASIVTDYTCAPFWEETDLDYYFLPHKDLIKEFEDKGLDFSKLIAFGLPIDSKFKVKTPKEKAKVRLGLEKNKPHILIMGGSMGAGSVKDTTLYISKHLKECNITTICGNNKELFKEISEIEKLNPRIHALQFTHEMNELMDSADILVTKPGGLTSTEAMNKSLPIVMINPIPGVESANCNFFMKHNLGVKSNSLHETLKICQKLISDKNFYEKIVSSQKLNSNINAAEDICKFLITKYHEIQYNSDNNSL